MIVEVQFEYTVRTKDRLSEKIVATIHSALNKI